MDRVDLRQTVLAVLAIVVASCTAEGDDDSVAPGGFEPLPLRGGQDAPILTNASVHCDSEDDRAWVDVSVTDPQGFGDLAGIGQHLRLFPDRLGEGQAVEEVFALDSTGDVSWPNGGWFVFDDWDAVEALHCGEAWWPAEAVITDATGNSAHGRIQAPIVD